MLICRSKMKEPTDQGGLKSIIKGAQCLSLVKPYALHGRQDSNKVFQCNTNEKKAKQTSLSATLSDVENKGSLKHIGKDVLDTTRYFHSAPVDTVESSDEGSSDNVEFILSSETENEKSRKPRKKKLHILFPGIKRSQSVGCERKLDGDDSGHFVECSHWQISQERECDSSDTARRVIHKTFSADAAMMASHVLPNDPQVLMKNKQKSSIASNMRKKLQNLKRRNTDSLLSSAIMTMRGTTKVTQTDAAQWAASFDLLLADKNGIEMFRNFLKSEFSEENIEFWIACEEFKTVRTNKLVSRAQRIYSDFIANNAPKQVNLDSKTRLETVTNLENPTRDLFKQAQKRIQFLMENDSYKRFMDSNTYRHLIRRYSGSEGR